MEQPLKYIVLVRGKQKESYKLFRKRVQEIADIWSSDSSVLSLKICLTVEKPPRLSVIPFRKDKVAAISIYTNSEELQLTNNAGIEGVYRVDEALPVSYKKYWDDGELTPGICLLTLFQKKKSIDYETFLDRWHNGHTPLSLRIHPLWHYSRNVVTESMNESKPYDGIVDEHFKRRKDLLNPFLFFGHPLIIIQRMIKVYFDIRSFLDYGSIESYLVREIHIKS